MLPAASRNAPLIACMRRSTSSNRGAVFQISATRSCGGRGEDRFSVVREYVGHGVGRKFHQEPSIPHYPTTASRLERLEPGVCFTVEPMINEGTRHTTLDKSDGWTVRTRDGKLSAQFEHSVLMTEDGPEILTPTEHGPQKGHKF